MEGVQTGFLVPADARCLTCGYLLLGLESPRCPECGREFDPHDPRTMHVGLPVGRLGSWLLSPVGRGADVLVYAAAGAILWGEGWLPGGIFITLLGLTTAGAYFGWRGLRAVARLIVSLNRRRAYEARPQTRPVIVLGIAVLACLLGLPQWFVLWIHQPLLQRHVRYIHTEMPLIQAEAHARRGMVGLLYVHDTRLTPSSVQLLVGPRGVLWYCEAGDGYEYGWFVLNPTFESFDQLLSPANWRWRSWY